TAGVGFASPLAIQPLVNAGNAAILTASTANPTTGVSAATAAANARTNLNNQLNINAANLALANAAPGHRPGSEYGWGIQGGLKFKLPFIAAGDLLYQQAAYSECVFSYTDANGGIGY